jgi:hypothetical protein
LEIRKRYVLLHSQFTGKFIKGFSGKSIGATRDVAEGKAGQKKEKIFFQKSLPESKRVLLLPSRFEGIKKETDLLKKETFIDIMKHKEQGKERAHPC